MQIQPHSPGKTNAAALEKSDIDYCCGGLRRLSEACLGLGISIKALINSLDAESVAEVLPDEFNFRTATSTQLIDHLLNKHHAVTKNELIRLGTRIDEVRIAHSQTHPELSQVQAVFETLRSELETHMQKEEEVLFPYIIHLEETKPSGAASDAPFGTIQNPVRLLVLEHDDVEYLLSEIRTLTNKFRLRSDGSISLKTLYMSLEDFETDVLQHIYLENNVLFPRALELERQSRKRERQ